MCLFPRIRFTTTTITAITSKMWMREPPTWVSRPRSHKTARITAIVHSIVCHFSFVDAVRIRLLRAGYFGGYGFVYYTTKSDNSNSIVLTSIHTDSWYPGWTPCRPCQGDLALAMTSRDNASRAPRATIISICLQRLTRAPDACCRPHVSTPALVGFERLASSPHMLVHLAVTNRPGNEIGQGLPSIRFSYLTDDSSDCPVACTLQARGEGRGHDRRSNLQFWEATAIFLS